MKKLLLSIVALCMCTFAFAGDVLYKTLTFPEGNGSSIGSYTDTWEATCEDFTWTIANFNNNKNAWAFIKCGRKNDPSVASISTPQVSETITKVVVTFDAVKPEAVNEAYLEVASDKEFTADVQKTPINLAVGEVNIMVPTPKANQYYRLVFDCVKGGANGFIVISKVQLYKYDAASVSEPVFTPAPGNYYSSVDVKIESAGADCYYSLDGTNYTKYTEPLAVSETCTISAYAQIGETKSNVKTATYAIAKEYASMSELLKETPTAEGWPVIVTLNAEEITGFYGGADYRNGVYLNYKPTEQYFELYCRDADMSWQVGDKLSGTAKGIYQNYNGTWEISLVSWDGITAGSATAVQAPVISFDEATATVTITDPSGENNTIYYTLNGADPDDASILYEGPFVIETAVQVRAVCYNDDDQKSAITTETCIPANAPYTTVAELIAGCTATSQNDAPTVTFTFEGVSVNGINGSNVFIQDATGSFLLYGKNANFNRGDVISGTVSGKLYSYNGLPELSVTDWNGVTATPTGAIVAPTVMNAADITAANASQFVYLQNMNFVSASTGGKHISYLFNQNGTDVTLFDQFDVLQNVVFNTEDKYNARVFVIPYKENIQYYAVATEDLEVISDKQDPETRFINIAYLQVLADGSFKIPADHYETLSDGAKTFTSSNEDVATVDNEGNVTLKSIGVAIITLTTASTAKYSEGKSTTAVSVVSHVNLAGEDEEVYISTGREIADPWEANDVNPIYVFGEGDKTGEPIFDVPQWIHGYIVGYADGALTKAAFNTEAGDKVVASNILLSANKNTTDVNECIPVALATSPAESKAVRAALNLKDNPDNLGKEVWIYGDIMKYFSVAGVKNVTDYSLDGVTPVSISDVRSAQTADSRIYNLQGQLLAVPQKGAINIIGGKKVYVDR